MEVLQKYLEFLWSCFQYDIHVFSKGWLYYWLLIPAAGYLVFFFLKWTILTAPVWLPIAILMRVANFPSPKCEGCKYKTMHEYESEPLEEVEEEVLGKSRARSLLATEKKGTKFSPKDQR